MKKLLLLLFLLVFTVSSHKFQTASDYFPSSPGSVWYSLGTALDSLNQPVDSFKFYRADSFATTGFYYGDTSAVVLSAYSSADYIWFSPFVDSTFYKFDGSAAYDYLKFADLVDSAATLLFDSTFIDQLSAFDGWYPFLNFAANVNQVNEIFSNDITVNFDTTTINIRVKGLSERLADETLQLSTGSYNTKVFNNKVSFFFLVQVLPPPIQPQEFPFFSTERTVWIAQNEWMVKEFFPSTVYDFSRLGGPVLYAPGAQFERTEKPIAVGVEDNSLSVSDFSLEQNYPNPFNPSTTIKYALPQSGNVKLIIYDMLGREVKTLVNGFKQKGRYKAQFDASQFSSGVYIYTLSANGFSASRKMVLMK